MLKNTKRVMERFRELRIAGIIVERFSFGNESARLAGLRIQKNAMKLIEAELERLGRKAGEN